MERDIEKLKPCCRGCKQEIMGTVLPVLAKLDPRVYKFLNTGNPYMIRTCPKCNLSTLIIL